MGEGLQRANVAAKASQFRLTDKRLVVLRVLAAYHPADNAPDHHAIAVKCGREYSASDWAHAPLRELLTAGLVEVAGRRSLGGRTWRITHKGRAAILVLSGV